MFGPCLYSADHSTPGDVIHVIRKLARLVAAGLVVAAPVLIGFGEAHAAPAEGNARVQVRIQNEAADGTKTPLEGVGISIQDAEGTEVGSGETDEQGRLVVEGLVGAAGTEFTIVIDEDTLPEDAEIKPDPLSGEEGNVRTVTIGTIGTGTKNLFTGEGRDRSSSWIERVPQRLDRRDASRPGHRDHLRRSVVDLRHHRTDQLRPRRDGHVRRGGRLPVQRHLGPAIPPRRAARGRVRRGCSATSSTGVCGAGCAGAAIGLISQLVVSVGLSIFLRNVYPVRFGGRNKPYADYTNQRQMTWWKIGITPARPDHLDHRV